MHLDIFNWKVIHQKFVPLVNAGIFINGLRDIQDPTVSFAVSFDQLAYSYHSRICMECSPYCWKFHAGTILINQTYLKNMFLDNIYNFHERVLPVGRHLKWACKNNLFGQKGGALPKTTPLITPLYYTETKLNYRISVIYLFKNSRDMQ